MVEVEVDVPGGVTSGRLKTTVTEIEASFDPAVGQLPNVDDKQREDAFGDRESAGLPPVEDKQSLPAALKAKLQAAPTAGLSAQLRNRGNVDCFIEGVFPQTTGTKLVGVARTLRFIPFRADLFKSHGGGLNEQKAVFDSVREDEVIVIEARGTREAGTLGDILALRAQANKAAGVVTDGAVRDYEEVKRIGLPVFSQGPHPSVLGRKHVPWDSDITIACGGAAVQPGDIIVGDDDGVLVIPRDIAEEVVDAALKKEHEDEWVAAQVAKGASLDGMFPPTGKNKEAYLAYVESNPVPNPAENVAESDGDANN